MEIEIENLGKIYPLTIREIATIGELNYNKYLSLLLIDKNNIAKENKDVDMSNINNYELLLLHCYYNSEYVIEFTKAIEINFKESILLHKDGYFYFGDIKDNRIINSDNFNLIQEIIKKINYISDKKEEEEYNPANDKAREIIEKIKRNKKEVEKNKKEEINLYSIISSIAWKSHIGIKSVWDLTIYQLYDAYYRLNMIDNYDKTCVGIYSGNVDVKKIDLKQLNWSKIINFN